MRDHTHAHDTSQGSIAVEMLAARRPVTSRLLTECQQKLMLLRSVGTQEHTQRCTRTHTHLLLQRDNSLVGFENRSPHQPFRQTSVVGLTSIIVWLVTG